MSDLDTALEQDLRTKYTYDRTFEPLERLLYPWLNSMRPSGDATLEGNELKFRLVLSTGWSVGAPDEGGEWAKSRRRVSKQGTVTRASQDATLTITVEAEAAGQGEGAFTTGGLLKEGVRECTTCYYSMANTWALGDATGRLATVLATVVASDTFVCDGPEFALQIRENMTINFADLAVGGSVQDLGGGVTEAVIESIDLLTHTVTLDRAVTVEAGWVIFLADTYGKRFVNGQANIIDAGSTGTSIFGIVRADFPKVNATIMDGGGGVQDYSEELLRSLLVQITQRSDMVPTDFWCNEGILSEHYRVTTPDRVFNQNGSTVPSYTVGANQDDLFYVWRGQRIKFNVDRSMPARTLRADYAPGWRKHMLIKEKWAEENGRMLRYAPAVGGGTYQHKLIGNMMGTRNYSHRAMSATGALTNLRDRDTARDA